MYSPTKSELAEGYLVHPNTGLPKKLLMLRKNTAALKKTLGREGFEPSKD